MSETRAAESDAPNWPPPNYTACSFALGRGQYCKGDVRFPATHATLCPGYQASGLPPEQGVTR